MVKNRGDDSHRPSRREAERQDEAADIAPPVLAWQHKTAEVPQAGLEIEREATSTEREEVAAILDLVAVDSLKVSYRLRPRSGELFTLEGHLEADIRQTCVVSLEEMTAHIEEPLSAEFWPADRLPQSGASVLIDAVEGEELLPIHDGRIEAGRLVFDVLALAIDPHPRKQEATFEWKDSENGQASAPEVSPKPNPFAVLAKLKKPSD